jgi:hypothetical protein
MFRSIDGKIDSFTFHNNKLTMTTNDAFKQGFKNLIEWIAGNYNPAYTDEFVLNRTFPITTVPLDYGNVRICDQTSPRDRINSDDSISGELNPNPTPAEIARATAISRRRLQWHADASAESTGDYPLATVVAPLAAPVVRVTTPVVKVITRKKVPFSSYTYRNGLDEPSPKSKRQSSEIKDVHEAINATAAAIATAMSKMSVE